MSRPPRAIKPKEKTLSFPGDLVDKVDIILFSELEGKVPHGAWAKYLSGLIQQDLDRRAAIAETQRGYPSEH